MPMPMPPGSVIMLARTASIPMRTATACVTTMRPGWAAVSGTDMAAAEADFLSMRTVMAYVTTIRLAG